MGCSSNKNRCKVSLVRIENSNVASKALRARYYGGIAYRLRSCSKNLKDLLPAINGHGERRASSSFACNSDSSSQTER